MSASNPSSDLGDARSLGSHERPNAQMGNPGAPQLVPLRHAADAVEEVEAAFKALWPSGKMPAGTSRTSDGWWHLASALDHLRDVFPERDHVPFLSEGGK